MKLALASAAATALLAFTPAPVVHTTLTSITVSGLPNGQHAELAIATEITGSGENPTVLHDVIIASQRVRHHAVTFDHGLRLGTLYEWRTGRHGTWGAWHLVSFTGIS